MGLLLNTAGDLMTKDMEKAETLQAFFAAIFIGMTDLQEFQASETSGKTLEQRKLTFSGEESGYGTFKKTQQTGLWVLMGSTRVLRKMDGLVNPHSIIFERSWQAAEATEDWWKASVVLIFKKRKGEDLRDYRLVSLTLIPGR